MYITSFYAAILALLFFGLSIRTLHLRRTLEIAIGDAGNPQMLRAMCVHGNFAEYVPLTLLLLFMLESAGAHYALLHGLCLCLLAGRLSHALGVSKVAENFKFRVFGMAMTFTALVAAAASLLMRSIGRLVA